MPARQHVVRLRPEERAELRAAIAGGVAPARRLARARALLKADRAAPGPRMSDAAIAGAVELSARTVARVRADFADGGVARALGRRAPDRAVELEIVEGACPETVRATLKKTTSSRG